MSDDEMRREIMQLQQQVRRLEEQQRYREGRIYEYLFLAACTIFSALLVLLTLQF